MGKKRNSTEEKIEKAKKLIEIFHGCSVVKNTCCSSRGPEFGPNIQVRKLKTISNSNSQGSKCFLLASVGTCIQMHKPTSNTHTDTWLKIIKITFKGEIFYNMRIQNIKRQCIMVFLLVKVKNDMY